MTRHSEIEERWTKYANEHLAGRTIVKARYMTSEELELIGWYRRCIVLELDNGTLIYPSRDDEGNGAGALFGAAQGEDLTFPVIRD